LRRNIGEGRTRRIIMPVDLTHIGKYRIERELGRGSMGVVYQAFDPIVERSVAIKTIRLDVENAAELLVRLRREAKSVGQLEHPNIVTLYEAGESEGLFYLAMQFIQGETLQDRLDRQRYFALREVLEIFTQICSGLDYAHQHGVIHRDIKPANIMITNDAVVKLTDFGIAKLAGTGTTTTGLVVGTPSYMSPEQALGRSLDGRSDIFSLGSILYEMMTGEKAFPGRNVTTVMYKIVHEPPMPLAVLQPGLDPAVEAIVLRALAKHPDQRFQTCSELADALEVYINRAMAGMARTAIPGGPQRVPGGVAMPTAPPTASTAPASSPGVAATQPAPSATAGIPAETPPAAPPSSPGVATVAAPPQAVPQPAPARTGAPLAWVGGGILGTLLLVILILLVVQMRQTSQAPAPATQPAARSALPEAAAPASAPESTAASAEKPASQRADMKAPAAVKPAPPAGASSPGRSTSPQRTVSSATTARPAPPQPAAQAPVASPPAQTTAAPAGAGAAQTPPATEPEPSIPAAPETYQAAMLRGDLAFQSGDYQKALAAYLKAYRLNPSSRAVKTKLRTVLTLLNRPEDAQKYR
jgi:serine/threonine protein kinase